MDISTLGEQGLIARLSRPPRSSDVIVGIGDDCAAIADGTSDRVRLYTTDMLVEGIHFDRSYFTARDIGSKAMHCNVSDVVACGGRPNHALISLALPATVGVAFVDQLFEGVYAVADDCSFDIVGGDLTRADNIVINVALAGETTRDALRLRSAAEPGDLIAVSGRLGGAAAGLGLFRAGVEGFDEVKRYHTNPRCRLDALDAIVPIAKAMADISDGLATDLRNICQASSVGAHLQRAAIPLPDGASEAATALGDDPIDYALFGGEDFELVYTLSPDNRDQVVGTVVGEICDSEGVQVDGHRLTRFGYDHFVTRAL